MEKLEENIDHYLQNKEVFLTITIKYAKIIDIIYLIAFLL